MDFSKVIENRWSVRDFSDRDVEEQKICNILEVFKSAPTAKNMQPVRLIAVQGDSLNIVDEVSPCRYGAKLAFLVCSDESVSWKDKNNKSRGEMDATIAATHIMLAAANEGLGSCWVCLFDKEKTIELFNLENNIEPHCFMMVGYPSDKAVPADRHTIRNDLKDVVKYIK